MKKIWKEDVLLTYFFYTKNSMKKVSWNVKQAISLEYLESIKYEKSMKSKDEKSKYFFEKKKNGKSMRKVFWLLLKEIESVDR